MRFTENLDPRTEEGYRNAIELLASAKKQLNSELGRTVANLFGFDSDDVLDSLYKKVDELHRTATEKTTEKTMEEVTDSASKCTCNPHFSLVSTFGPFLPGYFLSIILIYFKAFSPLICINFWSSTTTVSPLCSGISRCSHDKIPVPRITCIVVL